MDEHSRSSKAGSRSRLRFTSDSVSRETNRAEENLDLIADHYRDILRLLGEDPDREGDIRVG